MEVDQAADLSINSHLNSEPMATIDLSVKRKSLVDETEGTLDLSIPSSSVKSSSTSETNRRTQTLSCPHPFRPRPNANENWSDSPDGNMSDDEGIQQISNGKVNGHVNYDSDTPQDDDSMNEDEMPIPSPKLKELSAEELDARGRKLRLLKQELRNEEMKLVLLKKLKQSQLIKENLVNNIGIPNSTTPSPYVNNSSAKSNSVSSNRTPNVMNQTATVKSQSSQSRGQSVLNPPLSRHPVMGHRPIGPPNIGLNSHRNSTSTSTSTSTSSGHNQHMAHRSSLSSSMSRSNPVTTPPNVVMGYPLNELRAQTHNSLNSHSNSQLGISTGGSPGPSSSEMNQTPAQRQAAAKLALRKQLEKTLLQIPPPKPPPPEMHFIPNANNQEFIYYLGLETVVDFLTDSPNQNRPPPDPFECVQCGTDFTPVWKWQDRMDPERDRPAVICESCVTSNIKKALKVEHTNRLKTAFVKALQQEQEIEQRIASGATSPPLPSISPTPPQPSYNSGHQNVSGSSLVTAGQSLLPQAPPAHSSLSRLSNSTAAAAAAAVANSAALLQSMPKLSAAHQSALFAAQAQQLHQLAQSLPQPQPAHMLPFAPLLAAQASMFNSYSMLGKSGVSSNDLHRQYLLDMIPPRSLPQGSIGNWKT